MWTISLLKRNGWNSVKPNYWTSFGVMIVMTIISSVAMWVVSLIMGIIGAVVGVSSDAEELIYSLLGMAAGFIVSIYVISILETGKNRYFYRARTGDVDLGNLFWAFQGGRYASVAKVMFWRYLKILLWSLLTAILFCIPGVVKYYEYMLVPYLMAENPHLTKERVFEISKVTMHGEKWKCFLLQLSFAGWIFLIYLLVIVVFSILSIASIILALLLLVLAIYAGIYAVLPYYEATMAEFYACMRAKMLAMGITTEAELTDGYGNYYSGGYPNNPYQQNPFQTPYQQNPYQNPNPYEQQNPYQNPDSGENHKVNLNKDSDDHNPY